MEGYFQAAGALVIALILSLTLESQGKPMAILLSLAVCTMACLMASSYLQPVLAFLSDLQEMGNLDSELVSTLLKCVGICLISEIAALICNDAGKSAMAKSLHILTSAAVLWLSIPVFRGFLDLMKRILEEV